MWLSTIVLNSKSWLKNTNEIKPPSDALQRLFIINELKKFHNDDIAPRQTCAIIDEEQVRIWGTRWGSTGLPRYTFDDPPLPQGTHLRPSKPKHFG